MQILDCNNIHAITSNTLIPHNSSKALSNAIPPQYHDMFNSLGELPVEYTIQINPNSITVVNPTRRLPVSLRSVVKAKLDMMVDKQIITPVVEHTPWVSSMVVAQKKWQGLYMQSPCPALRTLTQPFN